MGTKTHSGFPSIYLNFTRQQLRPLNRQTLQSTCFHSRFEFKTLTFDEEVLEGCNKTECRPLWCSG